MRSTTVGLIINGASGHDIRRLVTAATVVDNAEKGAMAVRLLAGMGACGVERVLLMPTDPVIHITMRRLMRANWLEHRQTYPEVEWLDFAPQHLACDTIRAMDMFAEAGVGAACVLGGDGTQRLTAGRPGDIPITAISTGTNNVFPDWPEATVAGMATGLVASGQVSPEQGCVREHALLVRRGEQVEPALVDVAVSESLFVGARAIWRIDDLSEVYAVFTDPAAIGLSSVAAAVVNVPRGEPRAVRVRLEPAAESDRVVTVPMAPGLVVQVGVRDIHEFGLGEELTLAEGRGAITVDGEREIERPGGQQVTVTLTEGPRRIDIPRVMALRRDR